MSTAKNNRLVFVSEKWGTVTLVKKSVGFYEKIIRDVITPYWRGQLVHNWSGYYGDFGRDYFFFPKGKLVWLSPKFFSPINRLHMLRYCSYNFTGLDQAKHYLQMTITASLRLEWCLYVNDRLAASKIDERTNVLIDKHLSNALSYDAVLVVYNELLDTFNKNGYQV